MNTKEFQEVVWEQGRDLYRTMPWRDNTDPYFILVSELMLQQTQVDRVVPKFLAFIERFPTIQDLAMAPLADVLILWSGLGYNRRAKFLHNAAIYVVEKHDGVVPETIDELRMLPGVGVNTAGAIMAYGYSKPAVFIETNVRTVYFHHFFDDQSTVTDAELREIVEETVDREHPREWYWAMMDYGSFLKKQGVGRLDKSHHYKKQSPLAGSLRETRGKILKELALSSADETVLKKLVGMDDRFEKALAGLLVDGLVVRDSRQVRLP